MTVTTSAGTSVTWRVDRPCLRLDWDGDPDDGACHIAEMYHYGARTWELMCYTHGDLVGVITGHEMAA